MARVTSDHLALVKAVDAPFTVLAGPVEVPGTSSVVVGGSSGELARWDMATGELMMSGHTKDGASVATIAVGADGTVAVTSAGSARLGLYDASTLVALGHPMVVTRWPFVPQFTPEGTSVFGVGPDGGLWSWSIAGDSLYDAACLAAGRPHRLG
jgi:hypothetical protein